MNQPSYLPLAFRHVLRPALPDATHGALAAEERGALEASRESTLSSLPRLLGVAAAPVFRVSAVTCRIDLPLESWVMQSKTC